jgi:cytochrome c
MSGFEVNKIIAAIFVGFIIIFIVDRLGDTIINIENIDKKETAYKIEILEPDTSTEVSTNISDESVEPVSTILITASLENGEKIYKKCGTCHNYEKGSKSKVGPNLWNIINRPKGSIGGFAYSKALSEFGGKWTYEELGRFLYKPKQYINGTKMNFAGLKNVEDRADLILWLQQHSDNPVPLP